jgi:hydroxyquinol 1,2-dioxygenase
MDGPVGKLIERTDISHFRPAHIHFLLTAPGYKAVITHIFQEGAEYIESDVVFGTKRELVTPFMEHPAGRAPDGSISQTPFLTVSYDFTLVAAENKEDEAPPPEVSAATSVGA